MNRRALTFDPIQEARRHWAARWREQTTMAGATSLMRAQQIVLAAVDSALKPFDLTFSRYECLVLLTFSRTGSLPLGKMGERLMVHPTSVTHAIDRLEQQGFVKRSPHPADRRTTLADITPSGRSVAQRATAALVDMQFGLGPLSGADVEALETIIRKLRVAAGDFSSSAR